MIDKSNTIGELTEMEVMLAARRLGIKISIPFASNLRYDQIWDINNKLYRIQIKHANVSEDGSAFSVSGKSASAGKYIKDEIDAIVTYHNNILYFIPIDEIGQSGKTLRLRLTKNTLNQPQINWAYDYIIHRKLNIEICDGV